METDKTKGVYLVHELMELPVEPSPMTVTKKQYMLGYYVGNSIHVSFHSETLDSAIEASESLAREFPERKYYLFQHTIQTKLLTN